MYYTRSFDSSTHKHVLFLVYTQKYRRSNGIGKPPTRYSDETKECLEQWLDNNKINPYPNDETKLQLAAETGLKKSQVESWLEKARRAKGLSRNSQPPITSATAKAHLESWLHSHLDNPFPTEDEKMILAQQTGSSKVQVENWFDDAQKERGLNHKRKCQSTTSAASATAAALGATSSSASIMRVDPSIASAVAAAAKKQRVTVPMAPLQQQQRPQQYLGTYSTTTTTIAFAPEQQYPQQLFQQQQPLYYPPPVMALPIPNLPPPSPLLSGMGYAEV